MEEILEQLTRTQKEIETIRHLREDEHMMFKDIAKRMVELGYPKRWTSSYIQTYNNNFTEK